MKRPAVRPIYLTRDERDAIAAEVKDTHRFPINADNSLVHPGTFEGLDLESGRVRRRLHVELRARCCFDSGAMRVVTVRPAIKTGDVFWVSCGARAKRATSAWTLEVVEVDAARLQDMSEKEALREGAALMMRNKTESPPRARFSAAWDDRYGRLSWRSNPWVWVVRLRRYHLNVDRFLAYS